MPHLNAVSCSQSFHQHLTVLQFDAQGNAVRGITLLWEGRKGQEAAAGFTGNQRQQRKGRADKCSKSKQRSGIDKKEQRKGFTTKVRIVPV